MEYYLRRLLWLCLFLVVLTLCVFGYQGSGATGPSLKRADGGAIAGGIIGAAAAIALIAGLLYYFCYYRDKQTVKDMSDTEYIQIQTDDDVTLSQSAWTTQKPATTGSTKGTTTAATSTSKGTGTATEPLLSKTIDEDDDDGDDDNPKAIQGKTRAFSKKPATYVPPDSTPERDIEGDIEERERENARVLDELKRNSRQISDSSARGGTISGNSANYDDSRHADTDDPSHGRASRSRADAGSKYIPPSAPEPGQAPPRPSSAAPNASRTRAAATSAAKTTTNKRDTHQLTAITEDEV